MQRNVKLDAANIGVDTVNGTAILTGTVRSWAEHDSAVQAAWAPPGVTDVQLHEGKPDDDDEEDDRVRALIAVFGRDVDRESIPSS
jgi:hypothetical protein